VSITAGCGRAGCFNGNAKSAGNRVERLARRVVKLGLAVLLFVDRAVNYAEGGGRRLRRSVPVMRSDIAMAFFVRDY